MSEITKKQWDELNEKYEQLRQNEEMYRVAVGMTDHTITVVDIKARTLNQIYNEGSWTGIAVSMPDAPESIIATGIIHPDDCEGYREFYRKIYSGVPQGEYTMRVMEENRGWVWFTMYYQTIFNENNEPIRAICFSDDITVKKRAEAHYQQFKAAVTADADFVWEANLTTNRVLTEEARFDETFGLGGVYESYDQLSKVSTDFIPDESMKAIVRETFRREALIEAFRNAKREVTFEFPYDLNDGKGERWLHSVAYLMTDEAENITVILCSTDITESKKKLESLEIKAEMDALTGVYNRASFEMKAEQTLRDYPEGVHGFLMMDVDDFKHFNDNYGHAFGDSILQLVAGVLKDTFRADDTVGRVGGDEFAVVMTNVGNVEIVLQRAKAIRRNLMNECRKQDLLITVTMSIGIAIYEPGLDLRTMYLRADEAMYKSKRGGKDCASVYGK